MNVTNTSRKREKIDFPQNKEQIVTLEFDNGKQIDGRYGDQWMYALMGERIMFVDPPVHSEILRTGAKAGDTLSITKRAEREGRKIVMSWLIERLDEDERTDARTDDDGAGEAYEPPAWARNPVAEPMRIQPQRESQTAPQPVPQQAPLIMTNRQAKEISADMTREYGSIPTARDLARRIENGTAAPAAAPEQRPAAGSESERDKLLKCLVVAIDAAKAASRYGLEQGHPVAFAAEDIRALGLSVYIGQQKGRA